MEQNVNLCTCVDEFRKAAESTGSPELRDKLHELSEELTAVSDTGCAERLTPQLKCLHDHFQRCGQTPGSEACNRFFSHADKLIEACRTGTCC